MVGGFGAREKRATSIFVRGTCDARLERVRDAFIANIEIGEDAGGAVCVFRNGECVVDLTGGVTRSGAPYQPGSMQVLYSVTKGVTALCLMKLVDRRDIVLDAVVARYWPEFAENGKGRITVRQMLSHQAGLSGFRKPTAIEAFADPAALAAQLAGQAPYWQPGERHGYHALTFGVLAGELIRRVTSATVGEFLQEEFSVAMGLDLFIGLPKLMQSRIEPLFDAPSNPELGRALTDAAADPASLTHNAFNNPPIETEVFNDPAVWGMEVAGANGIGTARSLAALYSIVVDGPLRQISTSTVNDFRRECVFGPDLILTDQPTRFGAGFMLPSSREPMLSPTSFGHNGRGGSLALADPESGIAFAYLGNRCLHDPTPHSRVWRLLTALRDAL